MLNMALARRGLGEVVEAMALASGALQVFREIEDPSAAQAQNMLNAWTGEAGANPGEAARGM